MMSRKPFTCCISRPNISLLEAAFLPKRNEALGSFAYADSGGFPSMCLSSPAVLFGRRRTGCEVVTPARKRGQVETQGWTCRLTP